MNDGCITIISSGNYLIVHSSIKETQKTVLLSYVDFLELRNTSSHPYPNTTDQLALNIALVAEQYLKLCSIWREETISSSNQRSDLQNKDWTKEVFNLPKQLVTYTKWEYES